MNKITITSITTWVRILLEDVRLSAMPTQSLRIPNRHVSVYGN
jgi:hypothetical protein